MSITKMQSEQLKIALDVIKRYRPCAHQNPGSPVCSVCKQQLPLGESSVDSAAEFDYAVKTIESITHYITDDWCTLGVGDGSGSEFVHGPYDTIKRLSQRLLK